MRLYFFKRKTDFFYLYVAAICGGKYSIVLPERKQCFKMTDLVVRGQIRQG